MTNSNRRMDRATEPVMLESTFGIHGAETYWYRLTVPFSNDSKSRLYFFSFKQKNYLPTICAERLDP